MTVKAADGSNAKCDVVNGGYDQRAYLLVPPKNEAVARKAFEEYRSRVFPFNQRETRFRESIGPPAIIHVSTQVKSSLEVFKSLSASEVWQRAPAAVRQEQKTSTHTEHLNTDHSSISSSESNSTSTYTNTSFLRGQGKLTLTMNSNSKRRHEMLKTMQLEETTNATESTRSGRTSAMNSTYQARLLELEEMIKKQQTENAKSAEATSASIMILEEKLVRSLESQLALGNNMNQMKEQLQTQLDKIMVAVTNLTEATALTSQSAQTISNDNNDIEMTEQNSTQSTSTETSDTSESSNKVKSPEKKKQRPETNDNTVSSQDSNTNAPEAQEENPHTQLATPADQQDNQLSYLNEISTTLEARYTTNAQGSGQET